LGKRFAAVYILRRVVHYIDDDNDDGVMLLKPFMPLVRAVTRDQESFRLRSEALYLISTMLCNYPLLMPDDEFNELSLLVHSLMECMHDHLEWLDKKGASRFYIGEKDKWRVNYAIAIHTLILTAYKNAEVILKLLIKHLLIINYCF